MKLEKGIISGSQLAILVFGVATGSSLVLPPASSAQHEAWIAILFGLGEALIFAWIYVSLAVRFKGRTFVEISELTFGKYLGKLVSLLFVWFLVFISALVVWDFSTFFSLMMAETPRWFFALSFMLLCASAVRNGIEVIARCAQVLVPIVVASILALSVLLIKDMDFSNFLPLLDLPVSRVVIGAHQATVFPLAETVSFLMVIAFVNKQKEVRGSVFKGIIFAALVLALIALRNIGVLGGLTGYFTYPSFQAARLVNYGEVLTRLEILIGLNFMLAGFLHLSVFYYGASLGVAQLLGLRSYLPVVLPLGTIITALSLNVSHNFSEAIEFASTTALIHHPIFELGIPLLTLIVAIVRKVPRKDDDS